METRRAKERGTRARAREVGLGRPRRFFTSPGCARAPKHRTNGLEDIEV